MQSVKIVFDVDDTICSNFRRTGYDKCIPDREVIKKINFLHDELGFNIVLHTARGMLSCNGNEAMIIDKNKAILEKWLKDNDVHYDELIFCKPIADLYVDDKAMNIKDFKKEEFCKLEGGGSNSSIYRLGKVVKKEFANEEDADNFKNWIEDMKGECNFPEVYSFLKDAVYMQYINGKNLSRCLTINDLMYIINMICSFSSKSKDNTFDVYEQINILMKNISEDEYANSMIYFCEDWLVSNRYELSEHASLSHGDLILSNIIKDKKGNIFLIDSRYFRHSSSYLLDFAKLRMSLSGYDFKFANGDYIDKSLLNFLDSFLKVKGIYEQVLMLNLMYLLRLFRYKDKVGKQEVKSMIKELVNGSEGTIRFMRY